MLTLTKPQENVSQTWLVTTIVLAHHVQENMLFSQVFVMNATILMPTVSLAPMELEINVQDA